MLTCHFTVDDISIKIIRKNIRSLRLSVSPPDGEVKISAPLRMELSTIQSFAVSKLGWIRKHQSTIRSRRWITPPQFVSGESNFFLGKKFILRVSERRAAPAIVLNGDTMQLFIRPKTNRQKRQALLGEWYRLRLKEIIPTIIQRYEQPMGVHVQEWGVKKMKTRWGSCNIRSQRIWLNLELAKRPVQCIEQVVVHEMVHLLERKHNARFFRYMDLFLPPWRRYKEELNRFPNESLMQED
jgi:predicted metal-dependent hydrolase